MKSGNFLYVALISYPIIKVIGIIIVISVIKWLIIIIYFRLLKYFETKIIVAGESWCDPHYSLVPILLSRLEVGP